MADAPALGAGARKGVEVQILSPTLASPHCGELRPGSHREPGGRGGPYLNGTPGRLVRCCIPGRWPKVQGSWDRKPRTRTRTDPSPRLRVTVSTRWAVTRAA